MCFHSSLFCAFVLFYVSGHRLIVTAASSTLSINIHIEHIFTHSPKEENETVAELNEIWQYICSTNVNISSVSNILEKHSWSNEKKIVFVNMQMKKKIAYRSRRANFLRLFFFSRWIQFFYPSCYCELQRLNESIVNAFVVGSVSVAEYFNINKTLICLYFKSFHSHEMILFIVHVTCICRWENPYFNLKVTIPHWILTSFTHILYGEQVFERQIHWNLLHQTAVNHFILYYKYNNE